MFRRPNALHVVVVALVLAAGCLGGVPADLDGPDTATPTSEPPTSTPTPSPTATATPDPSRGTLDPLSLPWKPDPLRAGNVEVYVREYERSVRYNEHVGPSVVELTLSCQATLVAEVDSGYLVRAECRGSIHRRDDGGATSVGAFGPERVTYFVDDATVRRIDGADRQLDPYRADDGGLNVANPEGIAVVNADDRHHEVRLVVRYDGEAGDEPVLAERYSLGPGEGLDLRQVASREGAYNVTVEVGNETAARYRWQVASDTPRPGGVGVVVTPGGDALVIELPRMR